jgi:transforming growth factor-beta-induced protein
MKRWTILLVALLVVAVPFALAACADDTENGTGATEPSPSPTPEQADIVDTAVEAGQFNTLIAAVQAAGLEETLRGEGPFTVFAPTDEAFDALPEGTLDTLLEDPQGDLTQILTYHVVEGEVMSGDLSDGMMVTTLQGAELEISIRDGQVYVNDAMVVTPDVDASNGVIHVIDSVLLPPANGQ